MRTMTKMVVAASLAGLTTLASLPLQAQQGPPQRRGMDPGRTGEQVSVIRALDLALENSAELGLTEEAMSQLQLLRQEAAPAVEQLQQEREQLRQDMQDMSREERRARRESLAATRDRHRELMAPFTDRFQEILTVEQHRELRQLMRSRSGRGGSTDGARRPRSGRRGGGR